MNSNPALPGGKQPVFFYGYAIVFASFCLQILGLGMFNSFGVFINPLVSDFGWSRASLTGALSFVYVIAALVSIVLGRLNDRFGPRLIMTICGVVLGVGYLLMSRIWSIWSFYIFCCLFIGIGISGVDVVLLSTIARWFIIKRGLLTGIVKVGTGAGMFIMPLIINKLINYYGWRNTLIILGIIVLILFFIVSQMLVRDPFIKGLAPDGDRDIKNRVKSHIEKGISFKKAIGTRQFYTIAIVYTLFYTCSNTMMIHIVPHGLDLGLTGGDAAKVLSTLGAFSIFGRLLMGAAGDRVGNISAMFVCFIFLLSGLMWLQFSHNMWMLIIFAMIHGFAHGGVFSVISPILAELFGTVSHGLIFGITAFISSMGGFIGPVMAGYLFDRTGSYSAAFIVLAAMSFTGLITSLTLKPVKDN
ncbi:MAG: MFS transporter [Desulfatiglans sp.]|nr:MFS transporter [Desulfatiglans sp.]